MNVVKAMWIKCNPNPGHKEVPDCVIRALAIALNKRWLDVFDELCKLARREYSMPNADAVWGKYLYQHGFEPFLLPASCPICITIKRFCMMYNHGVYIVGTGSHAVAVIDGDYYDSWDCGDEQPSYFWRIH